MTDVLQDYMDIYLHYPVHSTWKKEERKERHRRLVKWQNHTYSQMPDISEIISFMENNPNLPYERQFILKLFVPYVHKDIADGNIEAIRYLVDTAITGKTGTCRDPIILICEALNWQYTPLELASLIIEKEPNNKSALTYKYKDMLKYFYFSIHEMPHGILDGMNGAEKSAIPQMLMDLDEFEHICNLLGREQKELINSCRRLYSAWGSYLDVTNKYSGFEDYLIKNKIQYD